MQQQTLHGLLRQTHLLVPDSIKEIRSSARSDAVDYFFHICETFRIIIIAIRVLLDLRENQKSSSSSYSVSGLYLLRIRLTCAA